MKKLVLSALAAAVLSVAGTGCVSYVKVRMLLPPVDKTPGVKKVMVLTLDSNLPHVTPGATAALGRALKIFVRRSPFFDFMKLESFAGPDTETTGAPDFLPKPEALKKLAAAAGADGVLMVRVEDARARSGSYGGRVSWGFGRYRRGHSWGVGVSSPPRWGIEGYMRAFFYLVRVKDAHMLSTRRIESDFYDRVSGPVSEDAAMARVAEFAASKFMDFIDVRYAERKRKFIYSRVNREVNRAVKMAYSGRWREAFEVWTRVLERDPEDPAANFNLGIYYEAHGMFPEALESYRRARSLVMERDAFEREIKDAARSVETMKALGIDTTKNNEDAPAEKEDYPREPADEPAPEEEPLKPAK